MSYIEYYYSQVSRIEPDSFKELLQGCMEAGQIQQISTVEKEKIKKFVDQFSFYPEWEIALGKSFARCHPEIPARSYLMAMVLKADAGNFEFIGTHWPGLIEELNARYHAPGGLISKSDLAAYESLTLRESWAVKEKRELIAWARKYCETLPDVWELSSGDVAYLCNQQTDNLPLD